MISALPIVPATPASHQAIRVFRDRPPSSVGLCADRPGCAAPGLIANPSRKGPMLAVRVLRASCEGSNLDRHDTNGRAGFAVDQVAANLPALAYGPILGLSGTTRVVTLGSAICIGRDHPMGHRAGKLFGEKGFDVHGGNSDPVDAKVGPMVLHVNVNSYWCCEMGLAWNAACSDRAQKTNEGLELWLSNP